MLAASPPPRPAAGVVIAKRLLLPGPPACPVAGVPAAAAGHCGRGGGPAERAVC